VNHRDIFEGGWAARDRGHIAAVGYSGVEQGVLDGHRPEQGGSSWTARDVAHVLAERDSLDQG